MHQFFLETDLPDLVLAKFSRYTVYGIPGYPHSWPKSANLACVCKHAPEAMTRTRLCVKNGGGVCVYLGLLRLVVCVHLGLLRVCWHSAC